MENSSLYDRLGLPPDASPEEIRHAYRQLVLRLHPDTNINKGETTLFIDIQAAYDQLSDPVKKAEYDYQLLEAMEEVAPLEICTHYSQPSLVGLPEPQLIYALVDLNLHPSTGFLNNVTPLNISLVVDCSTSMQGIRLDAVKLSAIDILRQLHPEDTFSLVKFNDRAELLLPASNLSDIKSAEMKIQLLQAGGGTEIYKGLEVGFSQVSQYLSNERVNHIILITDGRTYGDEASCIGLADQAFTDGIGISALGIGNKWNDVFLENITSKTGGICRYVSDISEIRNSILSEISRLGSNLTEKVSFNYTTAQKVELQSVFRLHPEPSPLGTSSPITFGIMPKQGNVEILMEFLVKEIPKDQENLTLVKGFLSYRIPRHPKKTQYIRRMDLERRITSLPINEPPPHEILNAITLLSLYRMQERARVEVEKGDIKSATRHLELLATHLLKKGESDLAESVINEVNFIQHNQSFSEDGEKRLEYGTRALLLPARTEERD